MAVSGHGGVLYLYWYFVSVHLAIFGICRGASSTMLLHVCLFRVQVWHFMLISQGWVIEILWVLPKKEM